MLGQSSSKKKHRTGGVWQLISAGFAAIFLLLGMVLWISLAAVKNTNNSLSTLVEHTDRKTTAAYQMRDLVRLRSSQIATLNYQALPEDNEQVFNKLNYLTARYNQTRLELSRSDLDENEQEITRKIEETGQRVLAVYGKVHNAFYSLLASQPKLNTAIGEVKLHELVLLKHLNDLVETEKELAAESLQANQENYATTQKTLTSLALAALLVGIVIAVVVVSRVASANRRIIHLANHDDLTGLANRRSFENKLSMTLARAAKPKNKNKTYALLYLDLDRFKVVNDTCGHHAGDELLKQLTALFTRRVQSGDTVARLGGDEFAIIATADSFSAVEKLADELRNDTASFIFEYENRQFSISMSIGVIQLDGEENDLETLMNNVDSACYIAKQSGRNRVHIAQKNDTEILRYRNSLESVQKIRRAMSDENFELFYQPVFDIRGDSPIMEHCEILLRIKDEDGALFSPEEFIPLAEKYNLMSGIDRWVVTQVIDWIENNQNNIHMPRLLINLSALSYTDELFLGFLIKKLESANLDYTKLAFEITETAAVDNTDVASKFINRIKQFGCHFALDDFGSGFSNFAYLKKLPIDYLKIDGTLVRNICHDTIDREMVRVINQIAHIVGAQTIAEFVENDDIQRSLQQIGVDYGQGYGLQKPTMLSNLLEQECVQIQTGDQTSSDENSHAA